MDSAIIAFLRSQKVLSLAVCGGEVYAASCFYAFEEERFTLVFASDPTTKHMQLGLHNPQVAGTIYDPDVRIERIRGVQFQGTLKAAGQEGKECYLQKFPFAAALKPSLWEVELAWVKMTDNRLGFGKKISWNRR